jgi:uncharacterized membrane-anchored protein YhcB (DUF1043 family)
MYAADPVSLLVGVALGVVVSRCTFLIWKERQDKLDAEVSLDEQSDSLY